MLCGAFFQNRKGIRPFADFDAFAFRLADISPAELSMPAGNRRLIKIAKLRPLAMRSSLRCDWERELDERVGNPGRRAIDGSMIAARSFPERLHRLGDVANGPRYCKERQAVEHRAKGRQPPSAAERRLNSAPPRPARAAAAAGELQQQTPVGRRVVDQSSGWRATKSFTSASASSVQGVNVIIEQIIAYHAASALLMRPSADKKHCMNSRDRATTTPAGDDWRGLPVLGQKRLDGAPVEHVVDARVRRQHPPAHVIDRFAAETSSRQDRKALLGASATSAGTCRFINVRRMSLPSCVLAK